MEFGVNDVESSMNETEESVESGKNVLAVISDFHNYGSQQTKDESKATILNNGSVPNTELVSNEDNTDLCNPIIFKVGDYYLCPECKETFLYLKNVKRHVKKKHPCLVPILFPPGSHKCNICKKSFKSIRSLQNHNRIHHKSHKYQKQSECPEKCTLLKQHKCPLCPETLGIMKLSEHFERSHNILLKPMKLNFGSYEKFCEWKKAIERVTKSCFVKQSGRKKNGAARHTFICHRSGTYISKANQNKRKLKAQGSRKMNAYCPAVMKVTVAKEGKCEVRFQSHHIGHEHELKHLNLTYEERIYIAEKLASNLPLSDILNDIKNSASKDHAERLCLLTRKDLHNIKSSLLKDRQSYLSTAKFDEKLTKDLKDIHDKHAESEHIKADITKFEKGWLLTSTEHNEVHLIKENSNSCDCPLVCVYCKVCVKSYICNCSDSYVERNMCKHIHFFCMERNKMLDASNCNDNLDCDNDMSEITSNSNSKQYDSLQPSSSADVPSESSKKFKSKNFIDSEKRCALKNKFCDLIDSLSTEEEYKLLENAIEDLAIKLKSVHIQSQDRNVIPAANHLFKTMHIDRNKQDQHSSIRTTNHDTETVRIKQNKQDQHNLIPATSHPFETLHINENKQDQHNSIPSTNHPPKTVLINKNTQGNSILADNNPFKICVKESTQKQHHSIHATNIPFTTMYLKGNTQDQQNPILVTNQRLDVVKVNKQNQHTSNPQKTTLRPLMLKMLKPTDGARAHVCYIHFAKAKNK